MIQRSYWSFLDWLAEHNYPRVVTLHIDDWGFLCQRIHESAFGRDDDGPYADIWAYHNIGCRVRPCLPSPPENRPESLDVSSTPLFGGASAT